jgi:hypothetical protein
VAAVAFQAPAVMVLAFIPMLFIAYAYRELNGSPRLRHDLHVGPRRSTRGSAGWAASIIAATSSSCPLADRGHLRLLLPLDDSPTTPRRSRPWAASGSRCLHPATGHRGSARFSS